MASTIIERLHLLEEHKDAITSTTKTIAQAAARAVIQERGATTTPPPHMHTDADATQEYTLIAAGFGRDRPTETIERVLRRLMSMTNAGARLGVSVGTGSGQ